MWPFSRWRKARERAFIREAFGWYIAPDLVDHLASRSVDFSLGKRTVLFVLLQLRDDDAASLGKRLKLAIDIAGDG